MPNIGVVLKSEIARLSKKAIRQEIGPTKSAANKARKDMAALRKQVQQLQQELTALKRAQAKNTGTQEIADETPGARFSAKGLRSLRQRLGLSAEEFGALANVSAATVYNWEGEKSTPRQSQKAAVAALRSIGKREARARLEAMTPA